MKIAPNFDLSKIRMAGDDDNNSGQEQQPQQRQPQTLAEAMKEAEEKPKSLLWLILTMTGLFALGVSDFLLGTEPNGCAMTYMFEYPAYVPVRMSAEVADRFPKYGLYVYGEGERMVHVRNAIKQTL